MKKAFLSVAMVLACCVFSHAATFKSSDGYSFDYPDSWVALDQNDREAAEKAAREKGLKIPPDALKNVSCFLANPKPGKSGFAANVNVIIAKGSRNVNEATRGELEKEYANTIKKSGLNTSNVKVSIIKAGGHDAFSVVATNKVQGLAYTLKQWQVIIPVNDKMYTLTCTAPTKEYTDNEAAFKKVIDSLKVDAGMPGWLWGAIVGGGIGAGVGGVMGFLKMLRKRPAAQAPAAPPGPQA